MKKLYSFLMTYFVSRTPWYIGSKFLRIKTASDTQSDYDSEAGRAFDFKSLLKDGAAVGKNIIDRRVIEKWQIKYGIYSERFSPCEGNISFPFYNEEMHELLNNSEVSHYINKYFKTVYGTEPVLQQIPNMVITFPSMGQDAYQHGAHNFPAVWHTDFKSEFTIHFPLTVINATTPHTKYFKGTHYKLARPSKTISPPSPEKILDCFGMPEDVIFLDVDGWHRAQLERGCFRVIVQLKYTQGNNLLTFRAPGPKFFKSVEKLKEVAKDFLLIQEGLVEDYKFINGLPGNTSNMGIIKDNSQLYQYFIKNNS